jgi:predicted ribosome quality control (RQC) complex YloA/Tae2 family protein
MSMTRHEIDAVVRSMQDILIGGRVQKIHQPDAPTIVMDMRIPGRSVWLYISCSRQFSRIHLSERKPSSPLSPPRFCQALRKHVGGRAIVNISLDEADRIVSVGFAGSEGEAVLMCELFGRDGNLIILDSQGRVIDAARRSVGTRSLSSGDAYVPPSAPPGKTESSPLKFEGTDTAFAAGRYYEKLIDEAERASLEQKLTVVLSRRMKKTDEYVARLSEELASLEDPSSLQNIADHLAAHLYEVKRGMPCLDVPDMTGEGTVHIPLDSARNGPENLDRLYAKARRIRRKKEALGERIAEMRIAADQLRELARLIKENASRIEKLRDYENGLIKKGLLSQGRSKSVAQPSKAEKPRRFFAADGTEILIGRSAQENDEVTFASARGNDWWFHVVGFPSSHVIARASKDGRIGGETILDAASLALLNSKLSRQGSGEVMYTQRKYVRKPKGAAPGKVIAESTKTVFVRLDEKRIKRLYESTG